MNEVQKFTGSESIAISKSFFESGMFTDIKSAQQALVKIMAGQEIGIPPFAAMTGIHIIAGKPTIGAGLIAARIKGSGKYDYRVIEQTDKACSIDFYQGKEKIGNSTFTKEQAVKAGTKNIDKFPANMLFARAISNGVKWYCPDVFMGPVYTPEEMIDAEHMEVPEIKQVPSIPEPIKPKPLPSISNKAFKAACERVAAGEIEVYDKVLDLFTLTEDQREFFDEVWDKGCIAADKLQPDTNDLPFNV